MSEDQILLDQSLRGAAKEKQHYQQLVVEYQQLKIIQMEAKAFFVEQQSNLRLLQAEFNDTQKCYEVMQRAEAAKYVAEFAGDAAAACALNRAMLQKEINAHNKLKREFDRNRRRRDKGAVYRCIDCDSALPSVDEIGSKRRCTKNVNYAEGK